MKFLVSFIQDAYFISRKFQNLKRRNKIYRENFATIFCIDGYFNTFAEIFAEPKKINCALLASGVNSRVPFVAPNSGNERSNVEMKPYLEANKTVHVESDESIWL